MTNLATSDGAKIVRSHAANLDVALTINNFDGALFAAASSGDNYHPEFFLLSGNASSNSSDEAIQDNRMTLSINQKPDLKFGMGISEKRSVNFKLVLNISPDTCLDVEFLCVNLSTPSSASYIATNPENDVSCIYMKHMVKCQPG